MYNTMINYIKENNPELMDKLTLQDLENIQELMKTILESSHVQNLFRVLNEFVLYLESIGFDFEQLESKDKQNG